MKLYIDIETYSPVDIKKSGAYKYFENFEIILIGYAVNDGPVKIIDLLQGEEIPSEFTNLLKNDRVLKVAHNANFERVAFNKKGLQTSVSSWLCTMSKAAYCGLPLSLEMLSKALNLEEKGKLSTGKALIKYFCTPNKPTQKNPQTRNYPYHDWEKWGEFKKYCANDVEAERAIDLMLSKYERPLCEILNYELDQKINDTGILIDLEFAKKAYEIDQLNATSLISELQALTGLDNPNSAAQLKEWLLYETGEEVESLNKKDLPDLLQIIDSEAAKQVLELRKKLSKTSTKKYVAMLNCACSDNRARGLFQYYGANRTGRWAGRLIQLQNLPQNHLKELAAARQLVKAGDIESLSMIYNDVPDVLSQLIRTAFIPSPGKIFAVADFSAIEARVIAWLAGEKWRMDVFETHGKIYEASASMMFKIPIGQVTKELRQKGKIAELALGYQGGAGALRQMGGEKMGLSDSEMTAIANKWRAANPNIVALWTNIENLANTCVFAWKHLKGPRGILFQYDKTFLTIRLPNGRKLFYFKPQIKPNRFGKKGLCYQGVEQSKKVFTEIETYGGKLVENIVQAISRDLLAECMQKLDEQGFKIVMHVHDEVVCEVDNESHLKQMLKIMSTTPKWAEGLPLKAAGYLTEFYKKD